MPIIELDEGPGDFIVKVRSSADGTTAVHLNIFEVSAALVAGGSAGEDSSNGQAKAAAEAEYVVKVANAVRDTATTDPKEAIETIPDARLYAILDKCERRYKELGEERERRPRSPQPTASSSGRPALPTGS